MSKTLNLAACLLERGRNFQRIGRAVDAEQTLRRLAGFRELTPEVAEETQSRLGELSLSRGRYCRARRHLTAALAHRPGVARYHRLMARCLAGDDRRGDAQRAADHYREALRLDPLNAGSWAEFGPLALRLGQTDEGLAALRRAAALAPDDPSVIRTVVEGLCEMGQDDEARHLLRAALFRNARDARFRRLWQDFQFRQARLRQADHHDGDSESNRTATILPFLRVARTPGADRRAAMMSADESPLLPAVTGRPGVVSARRRAQ